jgi:hypothetical protein
MCRKLVNRWQAAKRQQVRRQQPEVREAHAAAEKERRARRRATDRDRAPPPGKEASSPNQPSEQDQGAWSRSKKNFCTPFCDRPGCYEAVRSSCRCRARYCSDGCRQALQRVRDRERKWLNRNGAARGISTGREDRAWRPTRHTASPGHPRFP